MQTKSERIEAVKTACDAWSKVIDNVTQAIQEYRDARFNYHLVVREATKNWMDEGAIEKQKEAAGESNRAEEWRQEYHEALAITSAINAKIDELNVLKFGY